MSNARNCGYKDPTIFTFGRIQNQWLPKEELLHSSVCNDIRSIGGNQDNLRNQV